jgi:uncharacterized protein (TIGR02246 family)
MSCFRILMCCAVLLSFICGCAKKQATSESRAEDERVIRDLEIEMSRALAAKDLGKLVSLYADDAALYDERDPCTRGKDAIRETWKVDFARLGLTMSVEPRTVEVSSGGDLAWAHGVYTVTMNDTAGKPVADRWDYALVYTKQPDGKWRIMADSANAALRAHLFHKPPKSRSPYAPLAPLIGLACFLSGIWFLFGMPIVAVVFIWNSCRNHKLSTGFLVSAVMLIAYFVTAVLLWRYVAAHYWNLSFTTALAAAGDTARYGNPVEDTAEGVLVSFLVLSSLSAVAAGIITGAARWIWTRHRRAAM